MKLSYYCDSCKQENYIKTDSNNRGELHMRLGKDEVTESCKYCNHINTKHINRLIAVPNNMVLIIGFGIGLVVSAILFFMFGWFGLSALSIPIFIFAQQQKAASDFNKNMIRRK